MPQSYKIIMEEKDTFCSISITDQSFLLFCSLWRGFFLFAFCFHGLIGIGVSVKHLLRQLPPPQPVRELTNCYLLGTDYTEDTVLSFILSVTIP